MLHKIFPSKIHKRSIYAFMQHHPDLFPHILERCLKNAKKPALPLSQKSIKKISSSECFSWNGDFSSRFSAPTLARLAPVSSFVCAHIEKWQYILCYASVGCFFLFWLLFVTNASSKAPRAKWKLKGSIYNAIWTSMEKALANGLERRKMEDDTRNLLYNFSATHFSSSFWRNNFSSRPFERRGDKRNRVCEKCSHATNFDFSSAIQNVASMRRKFLSEEDLSTDRRRTSNFIYLNLYHFGASFINAKSCSMLWQGALGSHKNFILSFNGAFVS